MPREKFIPPLSMETPNLIIRKANSVEELVDIDRLINQSPDSREEFLGNDGAFTVTSSLSKLYDARLFACSTPLIDGDYLVILRTGDIIGKVSVGFKPEEGAIELCYYLRDDQQGKGYGPEALGCVNEMVKSAIGKEIDYITNPLHHSRLKDISSEELKIDTSSLNKVFGTVDSISNYRSLRGSLKSGAVIEAVLGDFIICSTGNGVTEDRASALIVSYSKALFRGEVELADKVKFVADIATYTTNPYTLIFACLRLKELDAEYSLEAICDARKGAGIMLVRDDIKSSCASIVVKDYCDLRASMQKALSNREFIKLLEKIDISCPVEVETGCFDAAFMPAGEAFSGGGEAACMPEDERFALGDDASAAHAEDLI